MKETLLILVPLVCAVLAFAWPDERRRPLLLPLTGSVHFLLTLWLFIQPPTIALTLSITPATTTATAGDWIAFDALARAVLPMVSLLFLVCSFYGVGYLRIRSERKNRVFVTALLALLGLLSLALQAQNLGLLWVSAEAATLVTVPLLHFNGTARAFEASWKYLLIGGTGIALSLLGSFCLGYASLQSGGNGDLSFAALVHQGATLSHPWLVAAWVLLLAGYGTKMGLAPMHTWKPDAYGEAPGIVGALLAGGVTTMAFVAILRVKQITDAAGAHGMTTLTLLAFGLFSMFIAALFLLGTPNLKRMLAYSSVEHMGILAVGAALGEAGVCAALFHVWTNSLTKGTLFLSAGNIHRAAGSLTLDKVSGMAWRTPASAAMLVAGMFAVTACPPFGPFFSELKIVVALLSTGNKLAAAIFLVCLLFAFFGLIRLVFAIVDGRPKAAARASGQHLLEKPGVILPPVVFLIVSVWLGLATPSPLSEAWTAAANLLTPMP
jgi:hydrogenase-4 component F